MMEIGPVHFLSNDPEYHGRCYIACYYWSGHGKYVQRSLCISKLPRIR